MRLSGKLLYFVCLAALAVVAALAWRASRGRRSPRSGLGGSAGDRRRRARTRPPARLARGSPPARRRRLSRGARAVAPAARRPRCRRALGFYFGQLRAGAHAYSTRTFPLQLAGRPDSSSCSRSSCTWPPDSRLSRPQPAPRPGGDRRLSGAPGVQPDGRRRRQRRGAAARLPAALGLPAGALSFARRARGSAEGVVAGAATAVVATVLALFLLVATPVAASKPWQDWSTWGPIEREHSRLTFDFMLNYPSLLDPKTNAQSTSSRRSPRTGGPTPSKLSPARRGCGGPSRARSSPPKAPTRTPTTCRVASRPCRAHRPSRSSSCNPCRPRSSLSGGFPRSSSSAGARPCTPSMRRRCSSRGRSNLQVELLRHRHDPAAQARRPGRPRPRLPGESSAATSPCRSRRPRPLTQQQWLAAMDGQRGRQRVARPVRAEPADRRAGDRPLPDHAAHRAVPAPALRLLARAAADPLRVALRGVPLRHAHRLLPAFRRRHGGAAALQRHPGPRGRRLHHRRTRRPEHLRRDQERCPRLGRGLLPRRRLGVVRPHAGRQPAGHRAVVDQRGLRRPVPQ